MGGPLPAAAFRRFGGKPPVGLICGRGQRREVAPAQRAGGSGPPDAGNLGRTCWAFEADGCTPLHRRYSHRGRRRQPSAPRFRLACDVPGGSGHFWTLLRAAMMTRPGGALGLREPTGSVSMRQAPIETNAIGPAAGSRPRCEAASRIQSFPSAQGRPIHRAAEAGPWIRTSVPMRRLAQPPIG